MISGRAVAFVLVAALAAPNARTLGKIGYQQYLHGAMADALRSLNAAYKIAEETGDENERLEVLSNIANVYADEKVAQYDRAIEYYRQLLDAYTRLGRQEEIGNTLFNLGSTFNTKGDYDAAELHFRRALDAFQKIDSASDVAYTKRSLALTLTRNGRAAEALPLLDDAIAFYERSHEEEEAVLAHQYRGIAYRGLHRSTEALQDLDVARRFYERANNVRFLEKNAEETALVYEELGDWKNAYETKSRHADLQQKLAETRRDELASRLRVEFDTEKKDQENRALARENALQLAVSALTASLAAALAILFWRQVVNTRRMRAMAMTDELTRLPNRRHILTVAEIAVASAKREKQPVAVVVIDIDCFKQINDTYGHAAGDTVLQTVARTCRLELRGGDQIGRIGGEEFLIVLQATTSAQAREIAERLRAAVEQIDLPSIAPDLRVTISLGVHVVKEHDINAAIAAADALLYRAKELGRNRVEMDAA
jgi:diguanylate cyclase (GGDEF)-like protein